MVVMKHRNHLLIVLVLLITASTAQASITVQSVLPDGPAAAAGLQVDDRFVRIDGEAIETQADLQKVMMSHQPGDTVPIEVMRDNQTIALWLTFRKSPDGGVSIGVSLRIEEMGHGGTGDSGHKTTGSAPSPATHARHPRVTRHADNADSPTVHFPEGKSSVEVPFRIAGGMVVVDVKVNDSEPVGFVIESGWPHDGLLMTDNADKIGFEFDDSASKGHPMGRPARNVRLEFGGLRLEGIALEVTSRSEQELLGTLPEDGLIGTQLLENLVVEIDWERSRVRFHDPSVFEAPADTVAVPLERRNGLIFAPGEVTVDGRTHSIQFLVDTGSAGALLLRSDSVAAPERKIADVTLGNSLYGPIKGDIARVDQFRLGGLALNGVVTRFLDGSSGMVAVGADANVGTAVLRRFVVTFDYSRNRMLLKPTAALEDPFPFTMTGIGVEPRVADDGSIGIVQIYANSPAARAGLTVGDRILSVNSTPVNELGSDTILDRFRGEPGTRIKLEVRHADTLVEIELQLETIL
jgi:membrane-associated protease RseP (regulator of RpoE activity)